MDRFVRNVLLLCFFLSALILCLSYVGTVLLGQQFEGTDEKIQTAAGPTDGEPIFSIPINHETEPILYGIIGAAGGFISGFFYVDVFYKGADSRD